MSDFPPLPLNPVALLPAGNGWQWRQLLPDGRHSGSFVPLAWDTIPVNARPEDRLRAMELLAADDDKPF